MTVPSSHLRLHLGGRPARRRRAWLACLALLALVVAGCRTTQTTLDPGAAAEIKRIGVLTPRMPPIAAVVRPLNSYGAGFIGQIVSASEEGSRKQHFDQAIAGQSFSPQDALTESLVAGLQARGFEVVRVSARRDRGDFLSAVPTDHGPAVDAYLDVVTNNYGYRSAVNDNTKPFGPWVELRFRLVRARDNAVLMQNAVTYNTAGKPKNVVTIEDDSPYQFATSDVLIADPPRAVQGMREALERSGRAVAPLLN